MGHNFWLGRERTARKSAEKRLVAALQELKSLLGHSIGSCVDERDPELCVACDILADPDNARLLAKEPNA